RRTRRRRSALRPPSSRSPPSRANAITREPPHEEIDVRRDGRPTPRGVERRAAGAARGLVWWHRKRAAPAGREHWTGPRERGGRPTPRGVERADGVRGHRRRAARAAREQRTGPQERGRPSARALELADGVWGHRSSGARAAPEQRTGPQESRMSAGRRKVREGVVVSDKMDKTVVVVV